MALSRRISTEPSRSPPPDQRGAEDSVSNQVQVFSDMPVLMRLPNGPFCWIIRLCEPEAEGLCGEWVNPPIVKTN